MFLEHSLAVPLKFTQELHLEFEKIVFYQEYTYIAPLTEKWHILKLATF